MLPFDLLFPDLARRETRSMTPFNSPELGGDTYALREFYCAKPGCDCRRTILHVHSQQRGGRVVATISYAFEPPGPPFEELDQIFLDPLGRQSELSEALLELVDDVLVGDPAYHDRLIRHYESWKMVVDDPTHPDHHKLPATNSGAHGLNRPIPSRQPRPEPFRREDRKVGANEPCPCGSGKKYKRCCR